MKNQIESRDPAMLRPLPQIKHFPRWSTKSVEFDGFVEDIRENGIKHPIQITGNNLVVDGETRRQAALALNLGEVPCVIVSEAEAHGIILRELVRRRNLTKGQLAYLAVPHLESALNEAKHRRLENLRKGQQIPETNSVGIGKTADAFAALMGFSDELLNQARRLHEKFEKHADLRKEWEPKILDLDDPIGLGACLAGIAGSDREFQKNREFGILTKVFKANYAEIWKHLPREQRAQVKQQWSAAAAALPQDMRTAMIEALQEV